MYVYIYVYIYIERERERRREREREGARGNANHSCGTDSSLHPDSESSRVLPWHDRQLEGPGGGGGAALRRDTSCWGYLAHKKQPLPRTLQ